MYANIWTNNIFANVKIMDIHVVTFLEKTGTEHDEDPSKKILKISDTGPLSSWKHDMIFYNI